MLDMFLLYLLSYIEHNLTPNKLSKSRRLSIDVRSEQKTDTTSLDCITADIPIGQVITKLKVMLVRFIIISKD